MEDEVLEVGVVIADRVIVYRHGLAALLRASRPGWSLAEVGTFAALLECLHHDSAKLVLIDLELPGMGRAEGLRRLRHVFPEPSVVVLSDDDNGRTILECLTAGAQGYVLKSATPMHVLRALETVLCGSVCAPVALTRQLRHPPVFAPHPEFPVNDTLAPLTDRQRAVFALLAQGCATKEIARRLNLAIGTVKVHLAAIYRALGARSRLEAVAKARGGFILPPTLLPAGSRTAERLN